MAVNLTGIDLGSAAIGTAQKTTSPQSTAGSSHDATQQRKGEVNITSTAALLAHLEKSLGAQPAVDPNRVAAVSKALEAGTYAVQPDKNARGLISSERTLSRLPLARI